MPQCGSVLRRRDNWLEGMRAKIGLQNAEEGDLTLVNELLALMESSGTDYCRYAVTRGTFPLTAQLWEEGDVNEQGSTRDPTQVAHTSIR
jgi:hypothetical protein